MVFDVGYRSLTHARRRHDLPHGRGASRRAAWAAGSPPPAPSRSRACDGVPDLSRLVGATVTSVESRGKHLLIGFDSGLTLRSHLRMRGSWHRYRPGEPWRLPARRATAVLETAEAVAVAFDTPVVELLTDADLRRSRPLSELGPDLLAREVDSDEALRRLRERDAEELGNALLDQRAVAGIGNVYKNEVAFLERTGSVGTGEPRSRRPSSWRRCGPPDACSRQTPAAARASPPAIRAGAGPLGLRTGRPAVSSMRDA